MKEVLVYGTDKTIQHDTNVRTDKQQHNDEQRDSEEGRTCLGA